MADTIVNDPAVFEGGRTSAQTAGAEGIAAAIHAGFDQPPLYTGSPPTTDGAGDIGGPVGGAVASNSAEAPISTAAGAAFLDSFAGQIYDRIHVIPTSFALGSVLSNQTRNFEVWNAYDSPRTLNLIGETGTDGITLNEPAAAPLAFTARQSFFDPYSFTVSPDGPATIEAEYSFQFPGESPTLTITGVRVTPLSIGYLRPFREGLQFRTDIIESRSGAEQRIRVRELPRNQLDVQYELPQDTTNRSTVLHQLYNAPGRVIGVPLFHWARPLLTDISAGAGSIDFDSTNADFRDSTTDQPQSLMLWRAVDDFEIVQIAVGGLGASTTTLEEVTVGPHAAGQTLVMPVREAIARDGIAWEETQTNYIVARISWVFEDVTDLADLSSLPVMAADGNPIMADPNIIDGTLEQSLTGAYDLFDNLSGPLSVTPGREKPLYAAVKGWYARGAAAQWQLRQILYGLQGRQKAFWLPTFRTDFTLAENIDAADLSIEVVDVQYDSQVAATGTWTGLRIVLNDGTVFYRKITDSTASVVAGQEVLTIDSNLGQIVTPADIRSISLMSLVRAASDEFRLDWPWSQEIEVRLPVAGVPG